MSNIKTLNVVVFGIGNVGSTLINQMISAKSRIQKQLNLQIKIVAIANSNFVFYNSYGITNTWESQSNVLSKTYSIEDIIRFVKRERFGNLVAIDATSSTEFVQNYIPLIQNGFHIVSANKIANTLNYEFYEALRLALKKYDKSFLYETNVGAGLPVIETVKNLYNSGEQIKKIRGVFSGSLSYIFNEFSKADITFSKVLSQASELGLTEPDAREDLSGNDVARKLLILARELNIKTEFQEVSIESLVPKQLNGKTSLTQFNQRRWELDEPFFKLKNKLPKNHVLRYVGELDVEKQVLQVKLISEEKNSVLGQLKGADSVFEIFTKSYGENPLVIQGAGAGKQVTARGVLSDVIKLSNHLN